MRMSRKATSGWCSAIASTALPPSSQDATIDSSGQASRSSDSSALRRISSSSAMTQVGAVLASVSVDMAVVLGGACRQRDGGGHAVGEIGGDAEMGGVAVGQAQAFAHVLQADAGAAALGVEAAAVVGDGDRHFPAAAGGADPDRAAIGRAHV